MTTANTQYQLMRECVVYEYVSGVYGTKQVAFDITIPEGYAMELHSVDFGFDTNVAMVDPNRVMFNLNDDPDEDGNPGHCAEKTIQSTVFVFQETTTGAWSLETWVTKDCHRTLLVQNPNMIFQLQNDPTADFKVYARIWFRFVKVSPTEILDLLRQQQY